MDQLLILYVAATYLTTYMLHLILKVTAKPKGITYPRRDYDKEQIIFNTETR